jgi:hypothetical protein
MLFQHRFLKIMSKTQQAKMFKLRIYCNAKLRDAKERKRKKRLTVATGKSGQGHGGQKWQGYRDKRGDDVCLWLLYCPKSIVFVESGSGMDAWGHGSSRPTLLLPLH